MHLECVSQAGESLGSPATLPTFAYIPTCSIYRGAAAVKLVEEPDKRHNPDTIAVPSVAVDRPGYIQPLV